MRKNNARWIMTLSFLFLAVFAALITHATWPTVDRVVTSTKKSSSHSVFGNHSEADEPEQKETRRSVPGDPAVSRSSSGEPGRNIRQKDSGRVNHDGNSFRRRHRETRVTRNNSPGGASPTEKRERLLRPFPSLFHKTYNGRNKRPETQKLLDGNPFGGGVDLTHTWGWNTADNRKKNESEDGREQTDDTSAQKEGEQSNKEEKPGAEDEEEKKEQQIPQPLIVTNVIKTVALWLDEDAEFSAENAYGYNGKVKEYRWDFDAADGVEWEKTGVMVMHSYSRSGIYVVTLNVVNTDGNEWQGETRVSVAEEVSLPWPSANSYFTCIALHPNGLLLAFDGFTVYRQEVSGSSDFRRIAHIPDGEAADPAFIKIAPDVDTVYLGAGAGGMKMQQSNGKIWRFRLSECAGEELIAKEVTVFPYHFDMQFGPGGEIYLSHNPGYAGSGGGNQSRNRISIIDPQTWKATLVVEVDGPSCGLCFDPDNGLYLGGTVYTFPAPKHTGRIWQFKQSDVNGAISGGKALGPPDATEVAGELDTTQYSIAVDKSNKLYASGRYDGEAPIQIDLTKHPSENRGDNFPRLLSRWKLKKWEDPYYSQMSLQGNRDRLGVVYTTDFRTYKAVIVDLSEEKKVEP